MISVVYHLIAALFRKKHLPKMKYELWMFRCKHRGSLSMLNHRAPLSTAVLSDSFFTCYDNCLRLISHFCGWNSELAFKARIHHFLLDGSPFLIYLFNKTRNVCFYDKIYEFILTLQVQIQKYKFCVTMFIVVSPFILTFNNTDGNVIRVSHN